MGSYELNFGRIADRFLVPVRFSAIAHHWRPRVEHTFNCLWIYPPVGDRLSCQNFSHLFVKVSWQFPRGRGADA